MKMIRGVAALGLVAATAMAQTVRVGTFDRPSIVVAYYRSPLWSETMKPKLAELQEAKASNNTKKVEELELWGSKHQELAHLQLAGEAPITDILEAMGPGLAEVARKANVSRIVAAGPSAEGSVIPVDVTDQLLDWLKADERTRSIVRDLRKHAGTRPVVH